MRLKRMYWIEIINFSRLCLMSSLPISDHSIARSQSMSYEHSSFSFSFSFLKWKPNVISHFSFLILIHIPFRKRAHCRRHLPSLEIPTIIFCLTRNPHSKSPLSSLLHHHSKSPLSSLFHHHSKSPFGCETNGGLLVARMGKSFNFFSVSRAMLSF